MKSERFIAVCVCALTALPITGRADILAICGASKGHAYYFSGAIVPASKAGWFEDAISDGAFQLLRNGHQYDIVFTDASGGTLSAKGDGGEIFGFENARGDLIITVIYPNVIETYVFWFSSAELIATFSQVKHATPITKHSLFKAGCRKP